ncbi:hypothetical protein [Flavobacterium sp. NRK F7]|uniref:hypothetical protein n=1 Tax=Flavobacterium sp. NRK F7 TaxID=2954930 RepID=UPI00209128CA|nr:hypothetical protein [Flavobacterium sp. NRK F7]MCO6161862.1 hypothetical protein [Flavobacterium sp. NRK F7]
MKFNKALYLQYILFLIIVYLANRLAIAVFQWESDFEKTQYSLHQIFAFLSISSTILLLVHDFVKSKNEAILGYVFLVTLTIKVVACYIFIAPVLNSEPVNTFEKGYFFILFVLFLCIDVYFTARLLNKNNY